MSRPSLPPPPRPLPVPVATARPALPAILRAGRRAVLRTAGREALQPGGGAVVPWIPRIPWQRGGPGPFRGASREAAAAWGALRRALREPLEGIGRE